VLAQAGFIPLGHPPRRIVLKSSLAPLIAIPIAKQSLLRRAHFSMKVRSCCAIRSPSISEFNNSRLLYIAQHAIVERIGCFQCIWILRGNRKSSKLIRDMMVVRIVTNRRRRVMMLANVEN
jgi:hypothetical protein